MNILLCTLGASWAVIPEVYALTEPGFDLYANHPQRDEIQRLREDNHLRVPDEIWVCTTQGTQTKDSLECLEAWWELMGQPIPLRIWSAQGTDQLASQRECEHFRELAFRLVLKASEQIGEGQLLLSLAGGRKTMSADLQRAAGLFGAHRLLHVVDSGDLPYALFRPGPHELASALSRDLIQTDQGKAHLMPLIVGTGRRNELLDVAREGMHGVIAEKYPLPLAEPGRVCPWPLPDSGLLFKEIDEREAESGSLLGNYLAQISERERHENWRQLYRLPTGIINKLREAKVTRDWLDGLPRVDLHRHLGGCLGLDDQKKVAEAVWQAMNPVERDAALCRVRPLLDRSDQDWDWDWPDLLKPQSDEAARRRSQNAATLLCHAGEDQLERNLWGVTEPRLALVRKHPGGFAAYERPGELTGSAILQDEAAIQPYAEAIVEQAVAEKLAYMELRGSPQKYLGGEGSLFIELFDQALKHALDGVAEADRPIIRFIVIVDRRADETLIRETVKLAVTAAEQGDFVVGLDLAGDERHNPEEMADWFAPAFEACLPITIHAGEGQSPDNIWRAAYHLHADRIGHGLTLVEKPELYRRFRDRGICLELCPTSNREVVGFADFPQSDDLPEYPLRRLWDAGLAVSLCTDNPGISRTDIAGEYLAASCMVGGITRWDALAMLKQGFVHAFLGSEQREKLLKRVDKKLYDLFLREEQA